MSYNDNNDQETLLDMNGFHFNYKGTYSVKYEATKTSNGVKYSLTLHDEFGTRVIGYDNAHPIKVSKGYKGKKFAVHHWHKSKECKGVEYLFSTYGKLMEDFYISVDKYIEDKEGSNYACDESRDYDK